MKEHPILFSAEMVRAILEGRKTQTRRVMKRQPTNKGVTMLTPAGEFHYLWPTDDGKDYYCKSPFGVPGSYLWVRETWKTEELDDGLDGIRYAADNTFRPIENNIAAADAWFEASYTGGRSDRWKPSIFMPRWAGRITLEITSVRVERVQEISNEDAIAEGVWPANEPYYEGIGDTPCDSYRELWDKINAKRGYSWASNPHVWVIEFRVVQP